MSVIRRIQLAPLIIFLMLLGGCSAQNDPKRVTILVFDPQTGLSMEAELIWDSANGIATVQTATQAEDVVAVSFTSDGTIQGVGNHPTYANVASVPYDQNTTGIAITVLLPGNKTIGGTYNAPPR